MAVAQLDITRFRQVSGSKYESGLEDPVDVFVYEQTVSAGQLVDFADAICVVLNFFDHFLIRKLVHYRLVSRSFANKFMNALVTGQDVPAGAQFPCLRMRSRILSCCLLRLSSRKKLFWAGCANISWRGRGFKNMLEAMTGCSWDHWGYWENQVRISSKLLLCLFKSDWGWPRMQCASHVMSQAPNVGIGQCAASQKKNWFPVSISSGFDSTVSPETMCQRSIFNLTLLKRLALITWARRKRRCLCRTLDLCRLTYSQAWITFG